MIKNTKHRSIKSIAMRTTAMSLCLLTSLPCIGSLTMSPVLAASTQEVTTTTTASSETKKETEASTAHTTITKKKKKKTTKKKKKNKETKKSTKKKTSSSSSESSYIPAAAKVENASRRIVIETKDSKERIQKLKDKQKAKEKQIKQLENQLYTHQENNQKITSFIASNQKEVGNLNVLFLGTPTKEPLLLSSEMNQEIQQLAKDIQDQDLMNITTQYSFSIQSTIDKVKETPLHPNEILKKQTIFDLSTTLETKIKENKQKIIEIQKQIEKKKQEKKEYTKKIEAIQNEKAKVFDPMDLNVLSHITVDDAKMMLRQTALESCAKDFVDCEKVHKINAVALMAIAAHESAWGTSRRAREDHNLTGYGVYSDSATGINKKTKRDNLMATAETLKERYVTVGGSYYEGTSLTAVNKHYCVGNEWAGAVTRHATTLMNRLQ